MTGTFIVILLVLPAISHASGPGLTIFFTSDTRGMLRRCGCAEGQLGGVSARAAYIKQNRIEGRTLVLDAGDTLFDGIQYSEEKREFHTLKGRAIFGSLSKAGYDAAALGEYDFSFGWDLLGDAARAASFPLLATNINITGDETGITNFSRSLVKEVGGARVAVLAVIDPGFPFASFERSFRGVTVGDPVQAVRAELKNLGQVDLVIVLAHMSVEPVETLAKALPEADIIIQGHSQEILETPIRAGNAVILKGFDKGKRIGRLDVRLGKGGVADYKYSVATIDEAIPPDPEVEGVIAGYRAKLKGRRFEPTAKDIGDPETFVGAAACMECHRAEFTNWSATGHAKAFASIERTGDQYDPECLPCHTTGYGYATGYRHGVGSMKDVTCEACHGKGSAHVKAAKAGDAEAASLIKRQVEEKTCRVCHDDYNSPNFEYEGYKARGGAHRRP